MKDLKSEEKKQLKRIRDKVYINLSNIYVYDKDKFVQKLIKETFIQTKKELIEDLLNEWIRINIKKESIGDFFMFFEKKFRADFQKRNYELQKERKR